MHLAKVFENHLGKLSNANLDPLKQAAIERHHATTRSVVSGTTLPEDIEFLIVYFQIFDELFFEDTLHYLCHLSFLRDPSPTRLGQASYPGTIGDFAVYIEIRNLFFFPTKKLKAGMSVTERLDQYCGTLLHEMVHAFFRIYSCRCEKCRGILTSHEGIGHKGHGESWLRVTLELERATLAHLGVRYDLGRSYSASIDTAYKPDFFIANQERLELKLYRK